MRALLDTNVFISYLLRSNDESAVARCVSAGILGQYTLLVAQPLLDEMIQRVAMKPYLARKIEPGDVDSFVRILREHAEIVPIITDTIPQVGRDPKDDYLIAYAFVGRADYLVTGDDDLLVIGQVGAMQIVTPRQFAALL